MGGPSPATLKRLFALSGNRCAFPGCENPLFDTSGTLIADVCHIAGDKPGAKRYDSKQSDRERHSFENLICLCANHHRVIDSDEMRYSRGALLEMKRRHEAIATSRFVVDDYTLEKIAKTLGYVAVGSVIGEAVRQIASLVRGKSISKRRTSRQTKAKRWFNSLVEGLRFAPAGELDVSLYKIECELGCDFFIELFRRGGWRVRKHTSRVGAHTELSADFVFSIFRSQQASNTRQAIEEVFNKCGFVKRDDAVTTGQLKSMRMVLGITMLVGHS